MQGNHVLGAMRRGLVAGAVGTVAMTVTQRLEMAITGRQGSRVPGEVGASLLLVKDRNSSRDAVQLNVAVHWAHGIIMGALRAALDGAGFRGAPASLAHFALVWGGDAALYRTLSIADVPWRWAPDELATDVLHKGVYAAVTGVIYDALSSPPMRTG